MYRVTKSHSAGDSSASPDEYQEVYKGQLMYKKDLVSAVLTSCLLNIYNEKKMMCSLKIEEHRCEGQDFMFKNGQRSMAYNISRVDGKSVYKGDKTLQLVSTVPEVENIWTSKFQEARFYQGTLPTLHQSYSDSTLSLNTIHRPPARPAPALPPAPPARGPPAPFHSKVLFLSPQIMSPEATVNSIPDNTLKNTYEKNGK